MGGFRILSHDELCQLYADFMKLAGYKDICVDPELQALTGEFLKLKTANKQDDARSDLRVLSFWSRQRRAFFDFVGYNPYARSYRNKSSEQNFRNLEQKKRREYEQRINEVEHADFSPMAYCITGGLGPQAEIVTKRLSVRIAASQEIPKSVAAGWMNCRISYAIIRSALVCVRGSRSLRPKPLDDHSVALAVAESGI